MASPFTIFRKHQKMLIATLGLLAMIAFVFLSGPVLDNIMSGSRSNPVVVSTKQYGDLTETELENLTAQRRITLNFLSQVSWEAARAMTLAASDAADNAQAAMEAAEKATENKESLWQKALQAEIAKRRARNEARLTEQMAQQFEMQSKEMTRESVVDAWVLAKRAEDLGLVVSDDAIKAFLKGVTGDRVTGDTIRQILKRQKLGDRQLFQALRVFLAARQLEELLDFSLNAVPPGQRWDYYQRLHRRATIEVIPVPVAKYVDDIQEPEESTLRDFFEQYKDKVVDPSSPDPGFRRPHRIGIEYVKAEIDKFSNPAAVTEEQIQQFYEQRKDPHYVRSRLPEIEEKKPATGEEKPKPKEVGKPDSGQKPGPKPQPKPAAKQPSEKQAPEERTPKPVTPKGGEAEKPPAQPKPSKGKIPPADQAPSPEKPKEPPVTPKDAKTPPPVKAPGPQRPAGKPDTGQDAPGKTSSTAHASPFRLASFLQAEPAEQSAPQPGPPAPKAEKPAAKPPEAAPKPAKPTPRPAEPSPKPTEATPEPPQPPPIAKPAEAAPKPAEPAPKSEKPAPKPGQPATKPSRPAPKPTKPAAIPPQPAPKLTKPGAETAKPAPASRFVPLEEVKDEIRDVLARDQAKTRIEKILGQLRDRMERHYKELILAITDSAPPPARLPMAELASENGLVYRETGLISQRDAQQLDIGLSRVGDQGPFLRYAFRQRPEYQPAISTDLEGNFYLFWKIEDAEEGIPSFDFSEAEKLEEKAEELRSEGDESAAEQTARQAKKARQETTDLRRRLVREWKMRQARSLARDAAKELMAKADKKDQTLKQTFAGETGVTVIDAGPFSWMTHGSVPPTGFAQPPLRLSQVRGLNMPGPDFMRTVFSMEPGEVGVAMNQPKTVAYVVRVDKYAPTPAVLWELFLVDDFGKYADVAAADRQEVRSAWMDKIRASAGLKWEGEANRRRQQ